MNPYPQSNSLGKNWCVAVEPHQSHLALTPSQRKTGTVSSGETSGAISVRHAALANTLPHRASGGKWSVRLFKQKVNDYGLVARGN